MSARAIDHLVLPTSSLNTARERLTKLGFTVAPVGVHPFGTANCCVYFKDDTFIEPLVQQQPAAIGEAVEACNMFVIRDEAYRSRRGQEGFSAVVFRTDDATADHAAFEHSPYACGPMLEFSRDFVDATGKADKAIFRLAFAADPTAPDFFLFTCQRVASPKVDRSALQDHSNGVTRIKSVILAAPEPSHVDHFIRTISRFEEVEVPNRKLVYQLANASLEAMTNQNLIHFFGVPSTEDRGLQARVVVFGVSDVKATEHLLKSRGVACEKFAERLCVHPAPGQGAVFAFEAA
jgi:hypothetical protein